MLASPPGTRLIYEPINAVDGAYTGEVAATLELPIGQGPGAEAVIAALRGQTSNPWVDQINRAHLVSRSVTKDVRALGVAGEVAAEAPDSPIVVLTRHPLAVARSVVDLGWTAVADRGDAIVAEVARWCEFHEAALGDERLAGACFISYESLTANPAGGLRRVLSWAATFDPTWRGVDVDRIDTGRPSSTDFLDARDRRGTEWEGVDSEVVARSLDEIARHGLDSLYGSAEAALVDVGELAAALRARSGS
jgi:hypothetical protein